jgi:phosphatidylserine/phosphatidylglycerophosphate/cardiolipin synthase-like enzyme
MKLNKVSFYWQVSLSFLLFLSPIVTYAHSFDARASYQVYFTPTHHCTQEIVRAIEGAQYTLYVQAYFLTSEPILSALLAAKSRQVDVKVMLDKKHPENEAGIKRMLQSDIPVWIDKSSGIAHNKIMIIDEQQVITGSFNFTASAERRNRENLLIITDRQLAKYYLDNWYLCQKRTTQEAPLRERTKQTNATRSLSALEKLFDDLVRWVVSVVLGPVLDRIRI